MCSQPALLRSSRRRQSVRVKSRQNERLTEAQVAHDVDDGVTAGTTTAEAERIKALEQEVRELRRANAILKSASAFFAAELDRPQK